MNNWVRPSIIGAAIGLILGVIILVPQISLIIILPALGFVIGKIWESEELRAKIRDLINHFFQ